MISDSSLKKLSLVISLIGIVALFLFTQFVEPKRVSISEITDEMIGQRMLVNGTVKSLSEKGSNTFFTIDDGAQIKAVIFNKKFELSENQDILAIGRIELYRNELEIIIEEIK